MRIKLKNFPSLITMFLLFCIAFLANCEQNSSENRLQTNNSPQPPKATDVTNLAKANLNGNTSRTTNVASNVKQSSNTNLQMNQEVTSDLPQKAKEIAIQDTK